MKKLPLLDIRKWHSNPTSFIHDLRHACHTVGFFTLRHDLPPGLTEHMLNESKRFFSLPLEQKTAISYERSPAFRGYMALGVENTAGRVDLREQVELASETMGGDGDGDGDDDGDGDGDGVVGEKAWPKYYERLRSTNPWPDEEMKQSVTLYVQHLLRLSRDLTDALGLALSLEKDALRPLFDDPFWQLKLAAVPLTSSPTTPPPPSPPPPETKHKPEPGFGVGAHTDTGFLTLLLQDHNGGLQVHTDHTNGWIDVPPSGPGVFVCNIGEVAELASGGYFRATPHRVLVPGRRHDTPAAAAAAAAAAGEEKRYSVPFFYNPTLSAIVEPLDLPENLVWERDLDRRRQRRWEREREGQGGNLLLRSYGENAFKSLARSHPLVFGEHHSDLRLLDGGRVVRVGEGGII